MKIPPPIYLLISILIAIILHAWFPVYRLIPASFAFVGIVIGAFGFVVVMWAFYIMKSHRIIPSSWQKPKTLVTTGPFRFSRNPIYLGMVIFLLGLTIYLGNITAIIAPIFMFIILDAQIIPIEEKLLEKGFKKLYVNYKKRVRKWI